MGNNMQQALEINESSVSQYTQYKMYSCDSQNQFSTLLYTSAQLYVMEGDLGPGLQNLPAHEPKHILVLSGTFV